MTNPARPMIVRIALILIALCAAPACAARDPDSCRTVRLSDIGWTDVTSTTGIFSALLRDIGYQPEVTVLSLPVTYASMRNKDIDAFIGNWIPSANADVAPYLKDHSVVMIRPNLVGAKYTLAVPAYTYRAGLHDFSDIRRFAPELNHQIYGIEPGNDGNRLILTLLMQNQFGLGDFKLIESSEQGMLAQVERAVREHAPIVFLGWDPHPMNQRFDIRYLTGGDATFGPNYGAATVWTSTRAGYSAECPNMGRLLQNLTFTTRGESEMMAAILYQHLPPETAGQAWIRAHPLVVQGWLDGVVTFDGRPATSALITRTTLPTGPSFEHWITQHKIPLGDASAAAVEFIKSHGRPVFDRITLVIRGGVDGLTTLLRLLPSWVLILALSAFAWFMRRSVSLVVFVAAALLFILNQGYWEATLETLSLVSVSALVSTIIGVPLGIAAAHRPALYTPCGLCSISCRPCRRSSISSPRSCCLASGSCRGSSQR